MVTQYLFLGAVALLAAQRLWELRLSARNERRLRSEGAVEAGEAQMPWMRAMHTAWLIAMPLEVFLLGRPFVPVLALLALAGVAVGQALRYAAIRTLGSRWTVKVIVLPGRTPVTGGIYGRIRHPNYLGVVLEVAFFPLLHTAWLTVLIFSVLNAIMLRARIRAEEQALREANDYDAAFAARPRFVP